MCAGSLSKISHVDTVGRHLHPSLHPCTKSNENFFGKPRGGTSLEPVSHLRSEGILTSESILNTSRIMIKYCDNSYMYLNKVVRVEIHIYCCKYMLHVLGPQHCLLLWDV